MFFRVGDFRFFPVAKDLEPFGIYAGSPLKRIKARSQRLLELEKQYLAAGSMISAT